LYNKCISGVQLFHFFKRNIENCLNCRPFRSNNNNLIIFVIICGANSGGIAQYERISVAQKPSHCIAAIPIGSRCSKYFCDIQIFSDVWRCFLLVHSLRLCLFIKFSDRIVQKVAYFFHYCYGIGLFFWVHPELYEIVKKLVGVCHIEISSDNQISVHPIVLTKEWMNVFNTINPESSVAYVAKQQFAYIWNVFFLCGNVLFIFGMVLEFKIDPFINLCKNILNGLCIVGANAANVALSRIYVQFNACKTSTVLSAVVLFF